LASTGCSMSTSPRPTMQRQPLSSGNVT
jgi:hypothetical protein